MRALTDQPRSDAPKPKRREDPLESRNDLLNTGDWLKDIIWDATRVSPELVDDPDDYETSLVRPSGEDTAPIAADPYNVSNDNLYEHSREARFRIRQTFGAIEVFHAQPAKCLQMPFVSPENACLDRPLTSVVQDVPYQVGSSILA